MTLHVARNACTLNGPDGMTYFFFNSPLRNPVETEFYRPNGERRFNMVLRPDEKVVGYRALHYSRCHANGILEKRLEIAPYCESLDITDEGSLGQCRPLFECVTPFTCSLPGATGITLSFWTNLSQGSNVVEGGVNQTYFYREDGILKFDDDNIEDIDADGYSVKCLCVARIEWELLKRKTPDGLVSKLEFIPVVHHVEILLAQSGGIAVDFGAGGGGGRGNSLHNHSDNLNCGFAYAVFAPGTNVQPIAWK